MVILQQRCDSARPNIPVARSKTIHPHVQAQDEPKILPAATPECRQYEYEDPDRYRNPEGRSYGCRFNSGSEYGLESGEVGGRNHGNFPFSTVKIGS
jgi:hypothetical protein